MVANFLYPDNVQASVTSWLSPQKVREITVVGERQMVVWNDMNIDEPVADLPEVGRRRASAWLRR